MATDEALRRLLGHWSRHGEVYEGATEDLAAVGEQFGIVPAPPGGWANEWTPQQLASAGLSEQPEDGSTYAEFMRQRQYGPLLKVVAPDGFVFYEGMRKDPVTGEYSTRIQEGDPTAHGMAWDNETQRYQPLAYFEKRAESRAPEG
jgi:hypothetical protein